MSTPTGCDTLLMGGSSFPYSESLPQGGSSPGVQIDLDGKMIDPDPILSNLRLGTVHQPGAPETHFQFPDHQVSFSRATTPCVSVGKCRRLIPLPPRGESRTRIVVQPCKRAIAGIKSGGTALAAGNFPLAMSVRGLYANGKADRGLPVPPLAP